MSSPDLGLQLPLSGVQLIEASAGTGKTHTLATLHARLVIESGLDVGQILAVTYTRAATAELRERLRLRLGFALQRIMQSDIHVPARDGVDVLLHAALAREGEAALRRRLQQAVASMDVAPIHTIHGFCQRALAEFALESGQPLVERELLTNEAALRLEVATGFWREHSRDAESLQALTSLASSPETLALMLQELLAFDVLEPPAPSSLDRSATVPHAGALQQLSDCFRTHGADAREQLRAAAASGVVNRARSADTKVDAVWAGFEDWLAAGDDTLLHANTFWYGSSELLAKAAKGRQSQVPVSPLFDAIEQWHATLAATQTQAFAAKLALLHRLRGFAYDRMQQLKRERDLIGYDDLILQVAQSLQGDAGEAFAQRLQSQYRVALVDEFQDTDPRQSAIFRRLFAQPAPADAVPGADAAAARALFLIGDPKQAIYRFRGGDVVAYLAARERADQQHALACNFRSRPCLLRAVETVFEAAGEDAFAHPQIRFVPVAPGGQCEDTDFLRDGIAAPGLTWLQLDPIDSRTPIEDARQMAARACARAILDLLQDASAGRAQRRDRQRQDAPVRPADIAVLVEKNADAPLIRAELAALGIPSVAGGRDSVLLSEEAADLRCLLQALRAPGDESRLRAALATRLLGFDAEALVGLDTDETLQREWQERVHAWRQRCDAVGPLAVVNPLCAANAARLLQLPAGERHLANYLQLGEVLQSMAQAAPGIDALLDAFERGIENADRDNEEEMLRLESDADRVTVLTLHKSKGLEFEFVFLPLLATHGTSAPRRGLRFARYHDGAQRVLHLLDDNADADDALIERELHEDLAERLRLVYVGLTRARLATWIVWGAAKQVEKTALAWLLHRTAGEDRVEPIDSATLRSDLQRLQRCAPDAIALLPADLSDAPDRFAPAAGEAVPESRQVQRGLTRDWWVYSYSLLAREQRRGFGGTEAAVDERGAADEHDVAAMPEDGSSRLVGARFGNCLHAVLEHAGFERWRDWDAPEPPAEESGKISVALRAEGYGGEADLIAGRELLTRLVAATLNVRLPEGLRLCELDPASRRDELEFHLSLAPVQLETMLQLLHSHGIVMQRQGFGLRRRIEGLLTGRIDLLYRHDGRYYVVDYKSNRLPDYSPAALQKAVRDSEYDLQYVLYSLAVHRWLRFRLGDDYDYERDFGGVRYLFARGIDPARGDDHGVHATRPPRALIEALDALFAGRAGVSA